MAISFDSLDSMHIDVLQEIGNIGAGNAATALSSMMEQKIDIDIPKVNLVEFNRIGDLVDSLEALTYGVVLNLEGDINGMMMFLLNKTFTHEVLRVLMGDAYQPSETALDEISMSAIQEVGNILCASYVRSISELTGLDINISVPGVAIDMAGALLSVPLIRFGTTGNKVLFIEENFTSGVETVKSHIILFTELDSLNLMLGKLGLL